MRDVMSAWIQFPETIKDNIGVFSNFWTEKMPSAADGPFLPNSVKDWHPQENEKFICENYKDRKIKYSTNQYGFRRYPEFGMNVSNRIFCFGSEETFGIGLSDEETWPYILGKKFGNDFDVKNYGLPNCSLEYNLMCYYQIMQTIPEQEYPEAVFFFLPNVYRTFHIGNFENGEPMVFHLELPIEESNTYEKQMQVRREDDEIHEKKLNYYAYTSILHEFFEVVENFTFIDQISKNRNIPWFWYATGDFYEKMPDNMFNRYFDQVNYPETNGKLIILDKTKDTNRDGSSWGKHGNEQIANHFYNLYERHQRRE